MNFNELKENDIFYYEINPVPQYVNHIYVVTHRYEKDEPIYGETIIYDLYNGEYHRRYGGCLMQKFDCGVSVVLIEQTLNKNWYRECK